MDEPSLQDVECCIFWPKGTKGYLDEQYLIIQLLALCKQHGFGRVPQLAAQIESIWRDPKASKKKINKAREAHFKMMRESWSEGFPGRPCPY